MNREEEFIMYWANLYKLKWHQKFRLWISFRFDNLIGFIFKTRR